MAQMLIAAFPTHASADSAVHELEALGYTPADLSIITQNTHTEVHQSTDENPPEGAISGAVAGGAVGGLAGLLASAGIVPALAGMLIGGPIAAALAATAISGAATGALAGGLIGAFVQLGVPEENARYYDTIVRAGGAVLVVPIHNGDEAEVRTVLNSHEAQQINTLTTPE
ncbi:DUF1269 domain-containing protein [Patescibacteria group bacterium]|nr:DUF1269 domain-containing protein [Patescibacteria group bacterium]